MKADSLLAIALALCACLLSIFIVWRFVRFVVLNTGTAIPTCVQLTIAERDKPMRDYTVLLHSVLRQLNHPTNSGSTETKVVAGSDDVYVFWDYPSYMLPPQQSTVRVCQWRSSSILWQDFAKEIQTQTMNSYSLVRAKLHRNPEMYECGDGCVVDVPVPLDFEYINSQFLNGKPVTPPP
jgi:hypothetical protein